ncbi:hypothetical protein [Blastopirellula retiformator]|nr:hypothetical protein [Blastopirellula retiformator]
MSDSMSSAADSIIRRPWSHAVAGAVALLGALVCGFDWPQFPQNLQHLTAAGLFAWGIAAIFLLVVAAGHFRVAILDWQGLQGPAAYERRNANLWIVSQAIALALVGVMMLLGRNSVLLMADQNLILAALSTCCLVSLVVWAMRRAALGTETT